MKTVPRPSRLNIRTSTNAPLNLFMAHKELEIKALSLSVTNVYLVMKKDVNINVSIHRYFHKIFLTVKYCLKGHGHNSGKKELLRYMINNIKVFHTCKTW